MRFYHKHPTLMGLPDKPDFEAMDHYTPANDIVEYMSLANHLSAVLKRPVRVVEVGSFTGCTAICLTEIPTVERVTCIDHWGAELDMDPNDSLSRAYGDRNTDIFNAFIHNISGNSKVHYHVGKSPGILETIHYDCDMVIIDGDHREFAAYADISAWFAVLANRGIPAILCGHDYRTYDGVRAALLRFLKESPGVSYLGVDLNEPRWRNVWHLAINFKV